MRALAVVFLKLMGIRGILGVMWFIPQIANAMFMASNPHGINPWWYFVDIAAASCINAAYAFVLLCRTDWVVAKLHIPDEPLKLAASAFELLRVGLVIVGVMALMDAIAETGSVLYNLSQQHGMFNAQPMLVNWGPAIKTVLELVLGFVVISKSRGIASRVFPGQR